MKSYHLIVVTDPTNVNLLIDSKFLTATLKKAFAIRLGPWNRPGLTQIVWNDWSNEEFQARGSSH